MPRIRFKYHLFTNSAVILFLAFSYVLTSAGGERMIVQLKDFDLTEVKSGGFTLPADTRVRIHALGAGSGKGSDLFAYGWIIKADTRELAWKMEYNATSKSKDDRIFDGELSLPKGSYEVYFTAYAFAMQSWFTSFNINVDRRERISTDNKKKKGIEWLDQFFGGDMEKDWKRRSKTWGIEIYTPDNVNVSTFISPKEIPNTLYKAVHLGEEDYIRQRFVIGKPMAIRIYALGEIDASKQFADYGWIIDAKTRQRIWDMNRTNTRHAGGADKNKKFNDIVNFPEGEYTLYYSTDDSHSSLDWNSPPPYDPNNYGIILIAADEPSRGNFKLTSHKDDENVIIQLTRLGDDENRSANFILKSDAHLRVYALGERQLSRRDMADYGWIINNKTREKVWVMESDRTEHAGGADKNRMIDEIITLPKGSYTVYFRTDDSHAYNEWNSAKPFNSEQWGITLYGAGENFDKGIVETNVNQSRESGMLAQITRVGDDAKQTQTFRLSQTASVRIYALGEGQNREMFDYAWIENSNNNDVVWEMTYDMTFHAGGARKNRMVNMSITLEKGTYKVHYVSDDSHSFNNWNMDPPDDPTMWGITLYKDE